MNVASIGNSDTSGLSTSLLSGTTTNDNGDVTTPRTADTHDSIDTLQEQQQNLTPNNGNFIDNFNETDAPQSWMTPEKAKATSLILLFLLSAVYQIYAGLKVATYPPYSEHEHYDEEQHRRFVAIDVLMCLSVLWINAEAYLFRTIINEFTRQDGLFLDPKVHRHPVFYQTDCVASHWCDLCSRRIGVDSNITTSTTTTPNNTSTTSTSTNTNTSTSTNTNTNTHPKKTNGVYRCSLCDFDVCTRCAHRSDSAAVSENILRTDSGARPAPPLNDSYLTRILEIARSELPLLGVSFVLLAGCSAVRVALPHLQGRIIDAVITDGVDDEGKREDFRRYITVYVVLMLVQGAVSTAYQAIFTLVSRRLKFTVRNVLYEKILAQDIAFFDGTESGRLTSRLTNDLNLMMAPIQSSLSSLLNNVLLLIGAMIMCFNDSYRLSMIAFVTIGPITYLWDIYAKWSKSLASQMLAHWADANSSASQTLAHVRTVKAFGCEDRVLTRYADANRRALDCGVRDAWGNAITSALTGYLDLGSGVLILYFGGRLVYDGRMSVGQLVTFQLFWNMMNGAYQSLQALMTSFTRSAAGAEKVFALWDSEPDIDPKKGADIDWEVTGHIEMKNVMFYYQMRPDNVVLENFDLDIPEGKTIALVGRSGHGKSTIINMLLRFYDPREGTLTIDGKEYSSLKVNQLRKLFGVVTQETELFATTVEENIAFGMDPSEYTRADVEDAAKKAYAHEFIEKMPDGYETRIGERGNRLSGGQRQRIAIARVFLRKPRIILLDEATSSLDENSQERVQQALATLIAESRATVVLVAHRLTTVMGADLIVVIDKGVALEKGSHEELVLKGGVYASMVQKQQRKEANQLDQEMRDGEEDDGGSKLALDDINALLTDSILQR